MTGKAKMATVSSDKQKAKQDRSQMMRQRWAEIKARKELEKPHPAQVAVLKGVSAYKEAARPTSGMSFKEISDIINLCHIKNVLSFQYEGLHITFKNPNDEPKVSETLRAITPLPQDKKSKEGAYFERTSELEGLSSVALDELEFMKINDPAAYEEFIQSEDAAYGRDQ